MATAGIIVIGNEVLSGKVEEANARYMTTELRAIGVDLERIVVVRDDVDTIAHDVQVMADRYDHVFTSGGVGATHDDVTVIAIARGLGVGVVRHAELEARLRKHYGDRVNDAVLRMADVPEGAVLIGESELSYPVVSVRNVYVLPGVPQFLRSKFDYLKVHLQGTPIALREIFVRIGEDRLAHLLKQADDLFDDVEIGSYPRFDTEEYRVKITVESRALERVDACVAFVIDALAPADIVRVGAAVAGRQAAD